MSGTDEERAHWKVALRFRVPGGLAWAARFCFAERGLVELGPRGEASCHQIKAVIATPSFNIRPGLPYRAPPSRNVVTDVTLLSARQLGPNLIRSTEPVNQNVKLTDRLEIHPPGHIEGGINHRPQSGVNNQALG